MEFSSDRQTNDCIFIAIFASVQFIGEGLIHIIERLSKKKPIDKRKYKKGDKRTVRIDLEKGFYWQKQVFDRYNDNGYEIWIPVN
jgi:hypothetical protein